MRRAHSDRGKARAESGITAFAPAHLLPGASGQSVSQIPYRDRLVAAGTMYPRLGGLCRCVAASAARARALPSTPKSRAGHRHNTSIPFPRGSRESACRCRTPHRPARHRRARPRPSPRESARAQLVAWSRIRSRWTSPSATLRIARPLLRQIQPPRDRHAALRRGQRQTHCNLAVLLFTQLAAVLARDDHRIPFLGTPCHRQSITPCASFNAGFTHSRTAPNTAVSDQSDCATTRAATGASRRRSTDRCAPPAVRRSSVRSAASDRGCSR